MLNIFRADMFMLKKSKGFKLAVVISLLCVSSLGAVLHFVQTGKIGKDVLSSISILFDAMMVSMLASLMIGSYICGDFQSKTVHSEVGCASRGKVIIVKFFTCMFITTLITLPYAIVSVICFASKTEFAQLNGVPSLFTSIMSNTSNVDVTSSSITKSAVLSLVGVLIYAARLSICIPLAFKVRKSVIVMACGIAAAFGIDTLLVKASDKVPILGTIFKNTPYAIMYDLNLTTSTGTIIKATISSIIFIAVMIALTYAMFKRSEIK